MFVCKACGLEKSPSEFRIHKRGYRIGKCKPCEAMYQRNWSKRDPEKYRERKRVSMTRLRELPPHLKLAPGSMPLDPGLPALAVVTLPWPAPGLSPNARMHLMALARLKASARYEARMECLAEGMGRLGPRLGVERVSVRVTFCAPDRRSYDDDNLIARFKAARDGIADAIGVDDQHWTTTYGRGEPVKGGAIRVEIIAA